MDQGQGQGDSRAGKGLGWSACRGKTNNRSKDAAKKAREISASEVIILQATQMLADFADPTTCLSVTVKTAKALQAKISNRLSPSLVDLYSQDYELQLGGMSGASGSAKSRGMAVLSDLQYFAAKLEVLHSVLQCVVTPDEIVAEECISSLERAKVKGIVVSAAIIELAIMREVSQRFAAKDWTGVVASLGTEATVEKPIVNLLMLPEEGRGKFQAAQLFKCLIDVMRPADNIDVLKDFVAQCAAAKMLSEELQGEMKDLALLLDPPRAESTEELEKAVAPFCDEGSERKLAQALTLFGTGQQIIAMAEKEIGERAKDKACNVDVDNLQKLIDAMGDLTAKTWTRVDGTPQLPDATAFRQLFETHAKIETSCSPSYRKKNETIVGKASKLLVQAMTKLIDAAESVYMRGEQEILEELTARLKSEKSSLPTYIADLRRRIDALADKKIYEYEDFSLDHVSKPDMECIRLFTETAESHVEFLMQLSLCTESLCSEQWDFIAENSARFVDMIQPHEGQTTAPHRTAFHEAVLNSLRARALTALGAKTQHLKPFLNSIDTTDMQHERADRFKSKADWHIVDNNPASKHQEVATLAHALLVKHARLFKDTDTVHSHGIYLVSVAPSLHDIMKAVSEYSATTDTTELVMTVIPSLSVHTDDVKAFLNGLQPDKWTGTAGKHASDTCTAVLRDVQCCFKQQAAKVLGEFQETLEREAKALQDAAAQGEVRSLMKMCSAEATSIVKQKESILNLINSEAGKDFYNTYKTLDMVCTQVASDEFMKVVGVAMKYKLPCHSSFDDERSKATDVKHISVPTVHTMTIVQAMFRALAVGETRSGLLTRCKAIIDVSNLPDNLAVVLQEVHTANPGKAAPEATAKPQPEKGESKKGGGNSKAKLAPKPSSPPKQKAIKTPTKTTKQATLAR